MSKNRFASAWLLIPLFLVWGGLPGSSSAREIELVMPGPSNVSQVQFTDLLHGVAAGVHPKGRPGSAIVWTDDGGDTWNDATIECELAEGKPLPPHFQHPGMYVFSYEHLILCGDAFALPEAHDLAVAASRLHDAGVSIAFSANAACLEKWRGTAPLILTNLAGFSASEIETLEALADRGVRLAALGDGKKLSPAAASLFGVTPEGEPTGGEKVGKVAGRTIVAQGPCLFIPLAAGRINEAEARAVAPLLEKRLGIPIHFPPGTCGYGFVSNGRGFIVVEDWREEPRVVPLEIAGRGDWKGLRAVNTNNHHALKTEADGNVWRIDVPLRPGDGVLVAITVEK